MRKTQNCYPKYFLKILLCEKLSPRLKYIIMDQSRWRASNEGESPKNKHTCVSRGKIIFEGWYKIHDFYLRTPTREHVRIEKHARSNRRKRIQASKVSDAIASFSSCAKFVFHCIHNFCVVFPLYMYLVVLCSDSAYRQIYSWLV